MSRVTSLDGLYFTNAKDDFKFYHVLGNTAPTVREIVNEYSLLNNHKLPTLTRKLETFFDAGFASVAQDDQVPLIVASINVQSIIVHSKDIESDAILN